MSIAKEVVLVNMLPMETFSSIEKFCEEKKLETTDELSDVQSLFSELAGQGIVEYTPTTSKRITVLAQSNIGPERLIRNFCRKNYGKCSPLISKKVLSAVLRRHGANYQIEDEEVKSAFANLAEEGLIRVLARDNGYIKILGSE